MTATTALVAVLAALLPFAWVGMRARRRVADLDDFVVARNSQGARVLGLSVFASGMGAWILFAPPEVGAFSGMLPVFGYAVGAALPFLLFALLGGRLRTTMPQGRSLAEYVRLRFGRGLHSYIILLSFSYMLVFVMAELTAVGAVTAMLTPLDGRIAVVAVLGITLLYTAWGGLRASLETDRWQAWLLIVLLLLTAIFMLRHVGDGGATPVAPTTPSTLQGLGIALTLVIAVTVSNLFHQGYWQRLWAARDQRALVGGMGLGMVASFIAIAVLGWLGVTAAASGLELGQPPVPFFALLHGAPAWVLLVVLALAVALVASSVDTLENALASLVVAERPAWGLAGARWLTVLFMVPAAWVALQGHSVLQLFLIADLLCATAAAPLLLGLWRRTSSTAAALGCVSGLLATLATGWVATGSLAGALALATFPDGVPQLLPFASALAGSTLATVAVSLLRPADHGLMAPAS